jgi:hypothetical protein
MNRVEIIRTALEAGNGDEEWEIIAKQLLKHFPEELERFATLVASAEREACAKVCDDLDKMRGYSYADKCATAIRARGQA